MKNEKWFAKELSQIEKQLKTNAATGLSRKAARSRAQKGAGKLFLLPVRSPLQLLLTLCSDFSLIMLLILALISLFFEEARNAAVVLTLTLGALLTAGILIYRAYGYEDSAAACFHPMARVIRGGRLFRVRGDSLVVGDVILVEEGDLLCCDARLVTSEQLEVSMRVDRERWVDRKKVASTHVPVGETRAWEMTNMLHGGSRVIHGSGRAIVTEVGRYTYLGAMTGGIELAPTAPVPQPLRSMRRLCSRAGLFLLVAVIPFTLISLFASASGGGTVLLSYAFLTALSLVATTASQLICSLCQLFYGEGIRRSLHNPHKAAFRSMDAVDRLAKADYVFMLDGGAVTDGILHFSSAVAAEGVLQSFRSGTTASYLGELASLYVTASTRTLSTGLGGSESYLIGLREWIRRSGVDEGALAIRCSVLSYGAGSLTQGEEQVSFSDRGERFLLHVSASADAISRCTELYLRGQKAPMSAEGRGRLIHSWEAAVRDHQHPLIFTVSSQEVNAGSCFVGMVILREGLDPHWKQRVNALRHTGCQLISFAPTDDRLPKLPEEILATGRVSKSDFVKRGLPVTEGFGRFGCYMGMSEEDIASLIRLVHQRKQSVWLMGMGEEILSLSEEADGVISYAPVSSQGGSQTYEEILSVDTPTRQSRMTCSYVIKERANLLIPRPSFGRGGLASLTQALGRSREIHEGLSAFWNYLIWIQWIRLIVIGFPMLIGQAVLDARHVLLLSVLMDGFALFAFMQPMGAGKRKERWRSYEADWTSFLKDRRWLIATGLSCVALLLVPEWIGLLGWMGPYLYKAEFSLSALFLLHLTLMTWILVDRGRARALIKNVPLLIAVGFVVIFLSLCGLWESFGVLFAMEKNPLGYLLLSLIPSALLTGLFFLFRSKKM